MCMGSPYEYEQPIYLGSDVNHVKVSCKFFSYKIDYANGTTSFTNSMLL